MKTSLYDYVSGSRVATELVNTSPGVRRVGGEALTNVTALEDFLRSDEPTATVVRDRPLTATDLREVLELRTRVRAILDSPGLAVVDNANELLSRQRPALALVVGDENKWVWSLTTPPDSSVADNLAILIGTGILATVHTLGRERIRACAASDCEGAFIDTSRAGRRRYCSPGLCGNRANVARFRARRRSDPEI